MLRKHSLLASLLVGSLALTAFSGSLQAAGQESGIPWWVWVLIILVLLALLLWWWLRRRPEERAIPTARPEPPAPPHVAEPPALSPTPPTPDDLTRIEGIGPKISSLLLAAGIATFAQLAETDVSRLEQIVREAGIRLADPTTWPEQAGLAAAGRWDELEALQDELQGGRR